MEITGKVHCFFEQSGTFKNEFIKLGIPAEDYDIQNNFGETDHEIDLFQEIEDAYAGKPSLFDSIRGGQDGDLIMAFFPCIYFCQMSQYMMSLNAHNYRALPAVDRIEMIIERQNKRNQYLGLLTKLVGVCLKRGIRMIFENPITDSYLNHYFLKGPTIKDQNRMLRGDYYVKPTGYWFWNCNPTHGFTEQFDKKQRKVATGSIAQGVRAKSSGQAGLCSEERSMISPDYARNFICDFIIGKEQQGSQMSLFD